MTFRQAWLERASKEKGFRKRRMERIADNPRAMKRAEQMARDSAGHPEAGAVDWSKIDWASLLSTLLPIILKLFGL